MTPNSRRSGGLQKREPSIGLLARPTRYLFLTGKGGVGKTTVACGAALVLADQGKRVLLVSTDPASNLDEMLGVALADRPRPVPGAPGLDAMNIDPELAAEGYRKRVIEPYLGRAPEEEIRRIREELSGACTVEIAAFDEFAGLLADDEAATSYDHVIFDTAPTGHTLRLLSLPRAWSGFLEHNDRGAACLGPHSGLTMRQDRFEAALASLSDPAKTMIVLVTRPETSALREAARTSGELRELGLKNQRLVVNAVFRASVADDTVAAALQRRGEMALAAMPASLADLPRDDVPLKPINMVGLEALRAVLAPDLAVKACGSPAPPTLDVPGLAELLPALAEPGRGLIMVMGKGGVGKTTIAAAIAVALADAGHTVHLSTTDPAAHLTETLAGRVENLTTSRIDPKVETAGYIDKIMATRGKELDDDGRALLAEDLQSPCTEEVAVFHAFARLVMRAHHGFVVLDTAPTGHSLLLLDATGSYHRQVLRDYSTAGEEGAKVVTPLMRLRDPGYCRILLVTLPEPTPVSEAAALQEDLRRAEIEPFAWVINASLAAAGSRDPLLQARIGDEAMQIARVRSGLARRSALVPWAAEPPVGPDALRRLARAPGTGAA
jgi:arsenite-transporting ATPase